MYREIEIDFSKIRQFYYNLCHFLEIDVIGTGIKKILKIHKSEQVRESYIIFLGLVKFYYKLCCFFLGADVIGKCKRIINFQQAPCHNTILHKYHKTLPEALHCQAQSIQTAASKL